MPAAGLALYDRDMKANLLKTGALILAGLGILAGGFVLPAGARAETKIIIKDADLLKLKGSEVISGTIYRVKRDDLRIETLEGKKVKVDLSKITFGDRLNEIFAEGMSVAVEGDYKDRDDFLAVAISFKKDKKTYTYRANRRIPLKNFYKNYID